MTDAQAVDTILKMPLGEFLGWLLGSVGASIVAGIAGHRLYVKKCGGPEPQQLTNGRLDAVKRMADSFDEFAKAQTAFTIHVQEQHKVHADGTAKQTEILGRMSETLAVIQALEGEKRG